MAKIVIVFATILVYQFCIITVDAQYKYINTGCMNKTSNYTSGSVYENNLNHLFGNLTSKTTSLKFYNYTAGVGSNRVYGLFQCRNDVSIDICSACIQNATQTMIDVCPLHREVIIWYYECMLRYANRNIFSLVELIPTLSYFSVDKVSNFNEFAPKLASAMKSVIQDASSTPERFASTDTNITMSEQVFSFGQCTLDLDPSSCKNCLNRAYVQMIQCCNASTFVSVLFPSCQLRYDTTGPFIFTQVPPARSPPPPPPPPPLSIDQDSQTSIKKWSISPGIIAAIAVSAAVGLLGLSAVLWICLFRKKSKDASSGVPSASTRGWVDGSESIGDSEFMLYDLATMKLATRDFSAENALGEGRFKVYKGTLNGQQLAIKRLSDTTGHSTKEFMAEARLLSKLQHKNLVRLMGVCAEGHEKLLVYEFLSNSSLDQFLFDSMKRPLLDWETRYKIIMGIVRGLQYLHEDSRLTIIHRDLKPSNILLDEKMNPKIADFGLAKIFLLQQNYGHTYRIMGTCGYMAPEFMTTGDYSDKSDVYSFGIMLLEIVSGQKNKLFNTSPRIEDLPTLAWRLWDEGRSIDLMDPALLYNNSSNNDMTRCIQIGLLCVQAIADDRPSMTSVVLMLTDSIDLPLPLAPSTSFHQFGIANSHSGNPQTDSDQLSVNTVTWQHTASDQDLYPQPR